MAFFSQNKRMRISCNGKHKQLQQSVFKCLRVIWVKLRVNKVNIKSLICCHRGRTNILVQLILFAQKYLLAYMYIFNLNKMSNLYEIRNKLLNYLPKNRELIKNCAKVKHVRKLFQYDPGMFCAELYILRTWGKKWQKLRSNMKENPSENFQSEMLAWSVV